MVVKPKCVSEAENYLRIVNKQLKTVTKSSKSKQFYRLSNSFLLHHHDIKSVPFQHYSLLLLLISEMEHLVALQVVDYTQCENFMIFLSLSLYVKSNLRILEVQNLSFSYI